MNSAANPETLAYIAKKCRDEEIARNMASITSAKAMGAILNDLADRIEAAAKRAHDIAAALLAAKGVYVPHPDPDDAPPPEQPTNASAMREALEKISLLSSLPPPHWKLIDVIVKLGNLADAALSAPARNCDRFANSHDAIVAFENEIDYLKEGGADYGDLAARLFSQAKGGAKCVDGLRGEPDCRGCEEHCLDVRKRNCFYWNPDIGKCALDGKPSCRIACDNFTTATKAAPPAPEWGVE